MPDARPPLGAWPGTSFCVWAPEHARVDLVLERGGNRDVRPLARDGRGYWSAVFDDVHAGDRYRYQLNDDDSQIYPDPASRYQPEGVHGPSEVVNPAAFQWTDQEWRAPRREELVFYELHVGTFSPEGTFRGVVERLPHLAQLGVNAIELMPVADFPGERNWGYDAVAIFAPARCYGRPDDLRALVNAAHQHGIAVFLDVVYNHLGPDGAYANVFSPYYFTDRHRSPWGKGVNMDGEHSAEVRAFFLENARHWIGEYHIDGLRLDATHAIHDDSPRHFLEELANTTRAAAGRHVVLVAEDHRNLARLLLPARDSGYDLDGVWSDDFHHQVRVHVAHDRDGYYADFTGSTADVAATIGQGWFFRGQHSPHFGAARGTDPSQIEPHRFVVFVQNHDQIGNRADGARLNHQVDAATFRAISTLLVMVPETPLIFQGQEWATTAPFQYFTDHYFELGQLVTKGRREEFAAFAAFVDPARLAAIPDPQSRETFERSRLRWDELDAAPHASMFRLYQRLIGLRASAAPLRACQRDAFDVQTLDDETLLIVRSGGTERLWIVVRLDGEGIVGVPGGAVSNVVLTTEDTDVASDPRPIAIESRGTDIAVRFTRAGAAILHAQISK
jgi:maltooligosyltrehalose trehalohydrolase